MNIEKLLIAILSSLLVLFVIGITGFILAVFVSYVSYALSIGQHSTIVVLMVAFILFGCLTCYFYKTWK